MSQQFTGWFLLVIGIILALEGLAILLVVRR